MAVVLNRKHNQNSRKSRKQKNMQSGGKLIITNIKGLILSVFFLCATITGNAQNQKNIDSLLQGLKKAGEDTTRVNLMNRLSWEYAVSHPEEAAKYAKEALELAEKAGYKKGIGDAYNHIGLVYDYQGSYDQALDYYFKALRVREDRNNRRGIASSYNNIGYIYHLQENFDKALEYHTKSLKIKEEIKDSKGMAYSYVNIGNGYQELGENDKALEHYQKSVKIFEDTTLRLYSKPEIAYAIASTYQNIGTVYASKEQYKEALPYFVKSLDMSINIGDRLGEAYSLNSIGNTYLETEKIEKASAYLDSALQIGRRLNAVEIIKDAAANLSNLYTKKQQYEEALTFHKLFKQMSDSLRNDENTKKITQLAMQYEFDKKQKEMELEQQKKDLMKEKELNRQKFIRNTFILGFLLMLALAFVIFRSYREKQKKNKLLALQNEEIKRQKEEIEYKNEEITASISYASRIQNAVLPPDEMINEFFPEYFILFKPRDIVSGDFYWATKIDGKFIITAADCTGHGVPGAFMSMLGMSFLNEIVIKGNTITANEILNQLREHVKKSLRQTGKENEAKDGMDIALCVIDLEAKKMQFSGAYNPLYLIRDGELQQVKADKMPIGIHFKEKSSFTLHELDMQKGDTFYIFSDGFVDQFGGEEGKKFMSKNFKRLLLSMQDKTMDEQKEILDKKLVNWIGTDYEQIDDVLVIGVKV